MSDWHCKQIPNGQQPIVVCERETLTAEIERLRAAGDALAEALDWNLSCPCNDEPLDGLDAEMNTRSLTAQRAWQEARRG